MRFTYPAAALALVMAPLAAPALAQEVAEPAAPQDAAEPQAPPAKALTVSGSVAVMTDYRLRGVSQSDRNPAVQGSLTIAHESGVYVGTFVSNLAGWGTFGGSNLELDAIGGFRHSFDSATVDVGLTWYMYPGGADKTDYAELFAKLSGTAGPATLLAGVAYAPRQQALGKWYDNGAQAAAGTYAHPGAKTDNLYLWGDGAFALPHTPFTARAHIGYSDGNDGLGPNATSSAPRHAADTQRQLDRHRHLAARRRLPPAQLQQGPGRARHDRGQHAVRVADCRLLKRPSMQDLLWILVMIGLVAATLAYVRLCDNA